MATTSDCSVCAEPFTSIVRTKISCGHCSYSACKTCVSRYLLSQAVDAHCMNCRTGWNRDFLDQHMTKAFRTGPWRDHRKKMIVNREKALLPNFQKYAAAKKRVNELSPLLIKARSEEYTILESKSKIDRNIYNTKKLMIAHPDKDEEHIDLLKKLLDEHVNQTIKSTKQSVKRERIEIKYNKYLDIYVGNTKKDVEKREFIMKCVKEGCRGFLSQSYKCELCNTYVCKDCMVVKKDRDDTEHVCKKDDIDTVSLIRKETRPCPKCGIRISKIDGCDQMFCVAEDCHTAFSWISGKIISGVIHNPHYYEWLRRNNSGEAPRNIGDIPCGGIPQISTIISAAKTLRMNTAYNQTNTYTKIASIHRCLTDLEYVRIPHYNVVRDVNLLKEVHVEYLLGIINEVKWTQSIYLKEVNIEKKQCIAQVLNTFMNAGADLMRTVVNIMAQMQRDKLANLEYKIDKNTLQPISNVLEQFDNLRNYINETLEKLAENISTPVPQFDKLYNWVNSSSYERIKAMRESEMKMREVSKVAEQTTNVTEQTTNATEQTTNAAEQTTTATVPA